MTDEDTLRGLATQITDRSHQVRTFDGYYDGQLRLSALGLSLPPEMKALQTVVNWPRLVVDALNERITLNGFRMRGAEDTDDRLWSWWQANDLDEEAPLLHLEAFVQGRGYICVGYDEDRPDIPVFTCESARNMTADVDPRTRKVKQAARLFDHDPAGMARAATLYLPGRNVYFEQDRGRWRAVDEVETGMSRVPIVPLVNRARLHDRNGRSEMADVMGLTDAACRNLTNLQGGQELMALPTRYIFGISDEDMRRPDGSTVPKWEAYLGRFNTLGDDQAKVVQLPAADLRNFADTTSHYARLVSSVTGLPAHYLGLSSDNPASADAIRSAEARHVKRAQDRTRVFSGAWETAMRLGIELVDGTVDEAAERMEALFDDPATPTYAQKVDAVVKLSGATLLPREIAWEELGWSPEKRRRAAQLAQNDPMNRLAASMGVQPDTGSQGGLLDRLGDSPTDGRTP